MFDETKVRKEKTRCDFASSSNNRIVESDLALAGILVTEYASQSLCRVLKTFRYDAFRAI